MWSWSAHVTGVVTALTGLWASPEFPEFADGAAMDLVACLASNSSKAADALVAAGRLDRHCQSSQRLVAWLCLHQTPTYISVIMHQGYIRCCIYTASTGR